MARGSVRVVKEARIWSSWATPDPPFVTGDWSLVVVAAGMVFLFLPSFVCYGM
jgi:hypothetical protein